MGWARKAFNGVSARRICARTRSAAVAAARPASSSPERAGEALANNSRRCMVETGRRKRLPHPLSQRRLHAFGGEGHGAEANAGGVENGIAERGGYGRGGGFAGAVER